jgi:cell pole-organizing protein PopZ
MIASGREPSMEEILASIKKVIAEDKDARTAEAAPDQAAQETEEYGDDILELNEELEPKPDLGPPLLKDSAATASRSAFDQLSNVAASSPPLSPQANPLEEMIREMLRPILKQWLDEHLPRLVDEHVRREISRITGRPV